ncbi:MAG: SDR family NAD(P)-dependent oxidoreductase [Sphingomonadales bacterium]|nr:SDR family NAD(P)-dependent oxidoreductase [Sphingomonadales bacterium]
MIDAAKYGPWAVIAGGSEGIGPALAEELAKGGINSVLLARKLEPLEATAADIRARYCVEVRTLSLDLTDPAMLERVRAVTDDIEVGLLVYNAGASHRTGPFIDWELDDVMRVIQLNVVGQTVLSHHFGRLMAARGRGGIVLMGSLAGVAGSPSVVVYSGAKAYSQIFSEGLWWELGQKGVDVLHVVVGKTDTPAMERLGIDHGDEGDSGLDVALQALGNLANGPVTVMPKMQEGFVQLCTPDRRSVTLGNASFILSSTEGTWGE